MTGNLAFIGAGNMGGAIAEAVCRGIAPERVAVYNPTAAKSQALSARCGCAVAQSAEDAVRAGKYIVLGVKPQVFDGVLRGLLPCLRADHVIVSIAAGVPLSRIEGILAEGGLDLPVVRAMPNTPVAVGQGLVLLCPNEKAEPFMDELCGLLAPCGLIERASERDIDLGMAVFSCSPAFVYQFIEAMADGGVQLGLPRDKSQRYAAQAVLGSAAMVLGTGKHPGQLKDEVCSPGGYTIRGVHALEKAGFRAAAAEAVVIAGGADVR